MSFKSLAVIFCVLSLTVSAFADDRNIKIYDPDESIEFTEDGVFINLNQELIEVNTLYGYDQGYFIVEAGRVVEGRKVEDCSNCDRLSKYNDKCLDKDCQRDRERRNGEKGRRPGRRD